jgi:Holliday junction resolvase
MNAKNRRNKGNRVERELVKMHEEAGVEAERMPLSGALGGKYGGDLLIDNQYRAEVKARANGEGFIVLEKWLGEHDFLFLKRNNRQPMVMMNWDHYIALLGKDID